MSQATAEGGGRRVIPAEKFNDDDLYVYDPQTLELHQVVPASCRRWVNAEEHMKVRTGLGAKNLGLWDRKEKA